MLSNAHYICTYIYRYIYRYDVSQTALNFIAFVYKCLISAGHVLPFQYLSRCIEAMTNTCFAKTMPKHHWLYRQVMFQICMHIEGVCIREGRQASVGEVAAQKAADDVTILEGGASDVEGTDGGADVANIGDSAAQIHLI